MLDATKKHVPRGKIQNYTPGLTTESRELIRDRDNLRAIDPTNPQITVMNNTINSSINQNLSNLWCKKLHLARQVIYQENSGISLRNFQVNEVSKIQINL